MKNHHEFSAFDISLIFILIFVVVVVGFNLDFCVQLIKSFRFIH